jgi:hypothetical protein
MSTWIRADAVVMRIGGQIIVSGRRFQPLSTNAKLGLHFASGDPTGTPFGFCFAYTPRDALAFIPES